MTTFALGHRSCGPSIASLVTLAEVLVSASGTTAAVARPRIAKDGEDVVRSSGPATPA
jgi:hypothetical protein